MNRMVPVVALFILLPEAEPVPRVLRGVQVPIKPPLTHLSAARELPDGRVLLTSAKPPSVLLLDPASGAVSTVGSPGAGRHQYAQPGGLYAGPDGTTQLLDRGRAQVLAISPSGSIAGARSVAVRGRTSASDADIDLQRLDARGFSYFVQSAAAFAVTATHATIVRFDPARQVKETVGQLRVPESRVIPGGDGVVFTQSVIGSPADGWGVAPDGRVAIVRADPYRMEWLSPDGQVTRGPVVVVDRIPMTDADRRAFAAAIGTGPSVSPAGGATVDTTGMDLLFAPVKAPFLPDGVLVSPEGRVWVMRTRPFGAPEVIYDIFDRRGARSDRVRFPEHSRVVGFGPSSVYVRRSTQPGRCDLMKYTIK